MQLGRPARTDPGRCWQVAAELGHINLDLTAGNFSRVDEYFRNLDRAVNEQVREIVEEKSKEAQAETTRLKEAVQLGDREREGPDQTNPATAGPVG